VLRFKLGMTPPLCSRCGVEQETKVHALHDCLGAKMIWQQFSVSTSI
jgi:hypothetical protein